MPCDQMTSRWLMVAMALSLVFPRKQVWLFHIITLGTPSPFLALFCVVGGVEVGAGLCRIVGVA